MTGKPPGLPELLIPSEAIPCPQCRYEGRNSTEGAAGRIGTYRGRCKTCNAFAQNVIRRTQALLKKRYPKEFAVLRAQVERDLYPQIVADWSAAHPIPQRQIAQDLGFE